MKLNNGNIICKATLVDCIERTKVFINQVKFNHQEYMLGIHEEGRFAWIIENISPIEPINVKGKPGLWDYII